MGLEQGARYRLVAPNGVAAVFNDPLSAEFVGYLTEPPSGLEGAETRGATEAIAEGQGGRHGDRFDSFLVPSLTGFIPPNDGIAAVNDRIERLQWATRAMGADGVLSWRETGESFDRQVRRLRRQQPPRFAGRIPKTFQLQMASEDYRVVSDPEIVTAGGTVNGTDPTVTNLGNEALPRITVDLSASATATDIEIWNLTTNKVVRLAGVFTGLTIDFEARTITENGNDVYGRYRFLDSEWWTLVNGQNVIAINATGGTGVTFTVFHRHGWA